MNGANGFALVGLAHADEAGFSVSGGDVNGDGFADLIIGAPNANRTINTGAGETYVVFGAESGWPSAINLSTLDGVNGFRLVGVDSDDSSGHSVAYAGDVNGDGYGDIIVGAFNAESVADAGFDNGHTYIVFGAANGWDASLSLADLDGQNGFRLDGYYGDQWSGFSVSGGGDINGDGFDDLMIGATQGGPGFEGETFIVFGAADGWTASMSLGDLDGGNGFLVSGLHNGDFSSTSIAIVGDVNADGLDDFVIGALRADPDGASQAGESYLVFGAVGGWPASFDLATLNGVNGFRIDGVAASDFSGASVAGAGDVNGDGFADIIIGAPEPASDGDPNTGEAYVVFGAAGGFGAIVDLAALDGDNGFRISGLDINDEAGSSVAGAGDVNGDGIDDIIVGAPQGFTAGGTLFSGEAYLIFGARPGEAVTRTGTALDNRIFGGAFADTLSGLAGDDRLDGGEGADTILGGAGLDTAAFNVASTAASWERHADGSWTVTADGVDAVSGVEILSFTDRDVHIGEAANTFFFDHRSDILWRRESDGVMAIWQMDGAAVVAADVTSQQAGLEWNVAGVGDFNGDGRDDLLIRNGDGATAIWTMDGMTVTSAALTSQQAGLDWSFAAVGDYDGDGRDDLLLQHTGGDLAIWFMSGASVLSAQATSQQAGAEWGVI